MIRPFPPAELWLFFHFSVLLNSLPLVPGDPSFSSFFTVDIPPAAAAGPGSAAGAASAAGVAERRSVRVLPVNIVVQLGVFSSPSGGTDSSGGGDAFSSSNRSSVQMHPTTEAAIAAAQQDGPEERGYICLSLDSHFTFPLFAVDADGNPAPYLSAAGGAGSDAEAQLQQPATPLEGILPLPFVRRWSHCWDWYVDKLDRAVLIVAPPPQQRAQSTAAAGDEGEGRGAGGWDDCVPVVKLCVHLQLGRVGDGV